VKNYQLLEVKGVKGVKEVREVKAICCIAKNIAKSSSKKANGFNF